MNDSAKRGLGWKRDPIAPEAELPHLRAALGDAASPPSASNHQLIVDVLDQGQAGACVWHAIPQAVRMAHVREGVTNPRLCSRLWGYYLSRSLDGDPDADGGTFLRSAFQVLDRWGFCPEAAWPYDLTNLFRAPPAESYREAFDQSRPTVYRRIVTTGPARIDDIKRAIAAGYGVCFGTDVSEDFCQNKLSLGPIPPPTGQPIAGGHALCAVAYNGDAFTIVNSWSTDWGDQGFCSFSADYLAWDRTNDIWIVQQAPAYSE